MDLDVLPPCIYDEGKGEAAAGLPPRMEGGMLPDEVLVAPSSPLPKDHSSPSNKSYQTYASFEATELGSLSSVTSDLDTSF